MGGNALTEVKTRRVDREEYLCIRERVLAALRTKLNKDGITHRIQDIPAYRTKETFGDLDVLVETFPGGKHHYHEIIHELFSPKQVVQNSGIYSFDCDSFQIDLILTPSDDYDTSLSYYSWNDLGNLTGRLAKKLGFKYGHKGLSYMFREQDKTFNVFAEVVVSRDVAAIMKFLDLDYPRFARGFDTVEEMFRWVSASQYFHKDIFLLHNRNHVSRTRDKKRKIYNEFLQWCAITPGLPEYPWTEMREQYGYAGKPEFLRAALNHFDGFMEQHANVLHKREVELRVKAKFNGDVVSRLTGLRGKDLGEFMQHLINSNGGKEGWSKRLLHATTADVERLVADGLAEMQPSISVK